MGICLKLCDCRSTDIYLLGLQQSKHVRLLVKLQKRTEPPKFAIFTKGKPQKQQIYI